MQRILLLILAILVAGCASTKVRLEKPLNRVGLIVIEGNKTFCHSHTGFTVFNNYTHSYEYPFSIREIVSTSAARGLEKENAKLVEFSAEQFSNDGKDLIEISAWDFTATINEKHKAKLQSLAQKENLDAVFILDNNYVFNKNPDCQGMMHLYTDTRQRDAFLQFQPLYVFSSEGEYSGQMFLNFRGLEKPNIPGLKQEFFLDVKILIRRSIAEQTSNLAFNLRREEWYKQK